MIMAEMVWMPGWNCPKASTRTSFRIGPGRFAWSMRFDGRRRRSRQSWSFPFRPMVCLMDGQRSLWTSCVTHLPREDVIPQAANRDQGPGAKKGENLGERGLWWRRRAD